MVQRAGLGVESYYRNSGYAIFLEDIDDEPALPPHKPLSAPLPPAGAELEPVRLGREALPRPLSEFWQWSG
jgi:hypothetical protein